MTLYTVTVTNQSRGWAYTMAQGEVPSLMPDVQLADELDFRWQMAQDQLPGHLEPSEATVRLWARDATKLPACEKGDRITLDVRMGTVGARILRPAAMKVVSAEVELTTHSQYAAQLVLRTIDALAELPAIQPIQGMVGLQGITGMNTAHARWRTRFAQLANRLLRTIGAPTWWADDERPAETQLNGGGATGNLLRGLDQPTPVGTGQRIGSASVFLYPWAATEVIQRLLNAHHPRTIAHTLTAGWSDVAANFPTGWRRVGPDTYWGSQNDSPGSGEAFTEPQTQDRYYIVPASRRVDGSIYALPLAFGVLDGQLTLIPNPAATNPAGHRALGLDAGWCELPAKFRKAREHAPNVITLAGQETYQQTSGSTVVLRDGQRVYARADVQLVDGTVTREVATALDLGDAADSYKTDANRFYSVEANAIQWDYLTDDTARTPWAPDEFTVHASRMPDAVAASVLPRLCPRQPGETDGDAQVIRHVTIAGLPPAQRFADAQPIRGFLVRGAMRITRGDIVFTLNLTPGAPIYFDGTPTPVTVGAVDASTYQAQPINAIDPDITITDLAYVANF